MKICHILQFYFDKGENASQETENVNSFYIFITVRVNHAHFWFRRYRSGDFNVKNVKNIDKKNGNRRVRSLGKHCFDCPEAKNCTKTQSQSFK